MCFVSSKTLTKVLYIFIKAITWRVHLISINHSKKNLDLDTANCSEGLFGEKMRVNNPCNLRFFSSVTASDIPLLRFLIVDVIILTKIVYFLLYNLFNHHDDIASNSSLHFFVFLTIIYVSFLLLYVREKKRYMK